MPETITAAASAVAPSGTISPVAGIVLADTGPAGTETVTVSDKSGTLTAQSSGADVLRGSGSSALTVTGSLADVNATLASLAYQSAGPAPIDQIAIAATGPGGTASAVVNVGVAPVVTAATADIWNGTRDATSEYPQWDTAGNWSDGAVPTASSIAGANDAPSQYGARYNATVLRQTATNDTVAAVEFGDGDNLVATLGTLTINSDSAIGGYLKIGDYDNSNTPADSLVLGAQAFAGVTLAVDGTVAANEDYSEGGQFVVYEPSVVLTNSSTISNGVLLALNGVVAQPTGFGDGFESPSPTLDGVLVETTVLNVGIVLSPGEGSFGQGGLTVRDGLEVRGLDGVGRGTIAVAPGGTLAYATNATLDSALVTFDDTGADANQYTIYNGGSLAVAAGSTLTVGNGVSIAVRSIAGQKAFAPTSIGSVGGEVDLGGTITVGPYARTAFAGRVVNTGLITASGTPGDGTTLIVGAIGQATADATAEFTNAGSIVVNGGTVIYAGYQTAADLGRTSLIDATAFFEGYLDDTGATLDLATRGLAGAQFGTVVAAGQQAGLGTAATVRGGTLLAASGLMVTDAVLDGATVEGAVTVGGGLSTNDPAGYTGLTLENGFTALGANGADPGSLTVTGVLALADDETLDDVRVALSGGEILFGGTSSPETLTIGAGATIAVSSGKIGLAAPMAQTQQADTIVNNGVILLDGGTLDIGGFGIDPSTHVLVNNFTTTDVEGTGTIVIDGGSVVLPDSIAATQTIAFGSEIGTLVVSGAGLGFDGTVSGLRPGDVIDVQQVAPSQLSDIAVRAAGIVSLSAGLVIPTIGLAAGTSLYTRSDGQYGTDIIIGGPAGTPVYLPAVTGVSWGDPHIETFSGNVFGFQQAGQFILAEGTGSDPFQVQVGTRAYYPGALVDIQYEAAVAVGGHTILFNVDNPSLVELDGVAAGLSATNASSDVGGGVLRHVTDTSYTFTYATGEVVAITEAEGASSYLNVDVTLPAGYAVGTTAGLLGTDGLSAAGDFTLPNGTVLAQPLSTDDLYGTFGAAWAVSGSQSLFASGAAAAPAHSAAAALGGNGSMTPPMQPALDSGSIPFNFSTNGAVSDAGITNAAIADAARFDYGVTGDPSFLTTSLAVQNVVASSSVPTSTAGVGAAPVVSVLGIDAQAPTLAEASSGSTSVTFNVYRTGPATNALAFTYAVQAPGTGFLTVADFGGTLPSGSGSFAAGSTSTTVTIKLPAPFTNRPSATLEVAIATSDGSVVVAAPTAQTILTNPNPVEGTDAAPTFSLSSGGATLTHVGDAWTLDFGIVPFGAAFGPVGLVLSNVGGRGANTIAGGFAVQGGDGSFSVSGLSNFSGLDSNGGIDLAVSTNAAVPGSHTETLTLTSTQSNASGFSAALSPETVTLTFDSLACFALGTRIAVPGGERLVEAIRAGDTVLTKDGRVAPVTWVGRRSIDCGRHPAPAVVRPVRIAAGAFAPGVPRRALSLSPDHAVLHGGALIPVKHLVNGTTVRQAAARRVTYLHIELDRHDVVLAEGLPTESYLDSGRRDSFDSGPVVRLYPRFDRAEDAVARWEASACAPLAVSGPAVDAARALLRARQARINPTARAKGA